MIFQQKGYTLSRDPERNTFQQKHRYSRAHHHRRKHSHTDDAIVRELIEAISEFRRSIAEHTERQSAERLIGIYPRNHRKKRREYAGLCRRPGQRRHENPANTDKKRCQQSCGNNMQATYLSTHEYESQRMSCRRQRGTINIYPAWRKADRGKTDCGDSGEQCVLNYFICHCFHFKTFLHSCTTCRHRARPTGTR